jgi:hypothetical protein
MGIIGLILPTIIAGKPSLAIGIYWARGQYNAKIDISSSMKFLAASATAAAATFLAINFIAYADWIEILKNVLGLRNIVKVNKIFC